VGIIDEIRQYRSWTGFVAIAVFGGLFPAVGEELFFRGFLGRGLVARWGRTWGVILTSSLFGLMHLQPLHVVMATLIGLCLHAVYLWTRSLLAPILLHAIYNCHASFLGALARNAQPDVGIDEHVPPALALTGLFAFLGLVSLLYRSRVRWVLADGKDWSPGSPRLRHHPRVRMRSSSAMDGRLLRQRS
jgi:membrane protease YdiL (CAAX protease family)